MVGMALLACSQLLLPESRSDVYKRRFRGLMIPKTQQELYIHHTERRRGGMAKSEVSGVCYPMNSGDHPYSYAHNSVYQKGTLDAAKNMLIQAIVENLDTQKNGPSSQANTLRIADLGCSTGPNTFTAVENIIEAVQLKYQTASPPELQVFFCDRINNDFSTLFTTLPPSRKYFASGVPGSFHGRLLPESTLHIAHSSYAVQFLSKLPEEIVDRKSAAFNKSHIHCMGTGRKEVVDAYYGQFCRDMEGFLNARAEEIVHGGLMLILLPSLPSEPPLHLQNGRHIFYEPLGDSLREMAKEGLISEERAESYNLPMYFASTKELGEIIEANGKFSIKRMEEFPHPTASTLLGKEESISMFASMLRASNEAAFRAHFGADTIDVDDLFQRYNQKLAQDYTLFSQQLRKRMELFIVLKRK